MSELIGHNCGFCVAHTLHDVYSYLESMQHRGREVVGICAIGKNGIDAIKWVGRVDRFSLEDLHILLPGHKYYMFLGHVRYATRGSKDLKQLLRDGHPHVIGGRAVKRDDHLIIIGGEMAIVHNGQVNEEFLKGVDSSSLKTGCDSEAILRYYKLHGEVQILKEIPGSYSMAIADVKKEKVMVMRDKTGIKPGILGWKDGRYAAASEDIAFIDNGGQSVKNLTPGAIYYFNPSGNYKEEKIVNCSPSYCFFEYNYIAHVRSMLNNVPVKVVRELLGTELAKEFHSMDADIVTFLPKCPKVAARAYAEIVDLPFVDVFYKPRSERAFMGSNKEERQKSIETNLFLVAQINDIPAEDYLKDKVVIVIDDSIIRGNNSAWARHLLYDVAKVRKAYLYSYTPQVGIIGDDLVERGCDFGGVDMPSTDNFIARNRSVEEISELMKIHTGYLSSEGMLNAFRLAGIPAENLCTFCIGGERPF